MTLSFSQEIDKIAAALVAAQAEFPAIAKDADNPFFKSKYADLESVIEVAQPILAKHGLAVSQHPIILDNGSDGLTTVLLHQSGQFLKSVMALKAVTSDPQAQGSAISYARRYALQSVLGLRTSEDDDGNAASRGDGPQVAKKASKADIARTELKRVATMRHWRLDRVAAAYAKAVPGGDLKTADAGSVRDFLVALESGAITVE